MRAECSPGSWPERCWSVQLTLRRGEEGSIQRGRYASLGVSFGKESAHTNKIRRPEWTGNPTTELTFWPARRIGLCRCRRCDTVSIRPPRSSQVLMGRMPEVLLTNVSAAGIDIASVAREPGS